MRSASFIEDECVVRPSMTARAELAQERLRLLVVRVEAERFLERERIRYVDSLPRAALGRLLAEHGAERALFGHVVVASERPLLLVVSARLVAENGKVHWSELAVVREEHAGGILSGRKLTTLRDAIHTIGR